MKSKCLIIKKKYIYLLGLLPILPTFIVSIVIILFSSGAFLSFLYKKKNKIIKRDFVWAFILFPMPFLLYLISLIWTDNIQLGINFVSRSLSFLILPIVFFLFKPIESDLEIKKIIQIFILTSSILVFLTFIYLLNEMYHILDVKDSYYTGIRLRRSIASVPVIGEHPIYFSLITSTALLLLHYNRFKNTFLNVFFSILLITGVILASSKGVILAGFITGIVLVFIEVKKVKKSLKIILLAFIGLIAISYFTPIRLRINEIIKTKKMYPEGEHFNSVNLRMAIYNCSFELIEKTPLAGFTPGDLQINLNECYNKFNTKEFKRTTYNCHNQFFDYYLSFGPLGFILLFFCYSFFLKLAIKHKNNQHIGFLILIYLTCLTENILCRNTGLVLFNIFNCLFAYSYIYNTKVTN